MFPSTLIRRSAGACSQQAWRSWVALHRRDDRGDVPGWVMITVMTAGLVAMITGVASEQLRSMLQAALSSVTG
ncbi:hypothetical protein BH20ACT6_BH20ACT6_16130 [soil metagenome]